MHRRLGLAFAAALIATIGAGAAASTITAEMRRDDVRLLKPITVRAARIYVGDLVAQLAAQSGVELAVADRAGAGDAVIAAYLERVPLGDALDSLWSLLSYRNGEYAWQREGKPDAWRYLLQRPAAARSLPGRLAAQVQDTYEATVRSLLEAADAGTEDRRHILEKLPMGQGGDPKIVDGFLASDRLWNGLQTARDALGEDRLASVLRGRGPTQGIRMDVASLRPAGRAFVHQVWADSWEPGAQPGRPEPTWVNFMTACDHGQLAPDLCILMDGIGGYAYAGGTPLGNALVPWIARMWRLDGDSPDGPADATTVRTPPAGAPAPVPPAVLRRRMEELHAGATVSLLARLPAGTPYDPGSPCGTTVGEFRRTAREKSPHLMSKWRGSVLLFDYPAWSHDAPPTGTWPTVVRWRKLRDEAGGYLPMAAITEAALRMSHDDLLVLAEDFPILGAVAGWQELIVAACPTRLALNQLRSREGRILDPAIEAAVKRNPALAAGMDWKPVRALRLAEEIRRTPEGEHQALVFGFVGSDGAWIPVLGVYQERARPAR